MSSGEIKVTDKRIFTPDGRLREEYSDLEAEGSETAGQQAGVAVEERRTPASTTSTGVAEATSTGPEGAPYELPASSPELDEPSFFHLVSLLAEHCALYLGDLGDAQGNAAENLQLARLHIDLLDVLRRKTAGNLDARESAMLDDVLYQLRVRFVQKRGG